MSILSRFFKQEKRSYWETLLQIATKGGSSSAGVAVSETSSMTMSAVWNALTLISETMSTVPLQIFRKTDEGRELYTDHPLYAVLHDKANRAESAQAFREKFVWNMEMRGIGLAEKVRDSYGQIGELWNITPENCSDIEFDEGRRLKFCINGQWYGQDRIFYCYGPGQDGLEPRGRLRVARESIGLGLAAQEYGSRFFGQGTHSGGFITHEGAKPLSELAYNRLKADLNAQYEGLSNAHKLILLEEGAKFQAAGMSNEDSQFLETRKFQISEIARFFNVKPHMLGDLERATFSNIEHQGIEAVTYCWRPRAVRIQQAINTQLLSPLERDTVYAEHNLNGLKQGDLASQATVWHSLIQDGVLNANEVRQMMNMNNQPGDQGDIYLKPMNMTDKSVPDERALRSVADYRAWGEGLAAKYATDYGVGFDHAGYVRSVGKLVGALEKRGLSTGEYTRMRNAFRYAGMQSGGVTHVIWRSHCPHCAHLDGKVLPIGEFFADGIKHPPLTDGCDCDVEAVK